MMNILKSRFGFFSLVSFAVLFFDQLSKLWIVKHVHTQGISQREYITSGNNIIDLSFATNPGAAFSVLSGQRIFFIIMTIIALLGILFYLFKQKNAHITFYWGLALVFGGALGNLIDRIRIGEVIDFIDLHWQEVYHWPTFNIADTGICTGVGLLIIYLWKYETR